MVFTAFAHYLYGCNQTRQNKTDMKSSDAITGLKNAAAHREYEDIPKVYHIAPWRFTVVIICAGF